MTLVNPFEEVVVFGKAHHLASSFGTDVRVLRALVPTGGHVADANRLTHVSGPNSGGPATALERYTRGRVGKASVGEGLKMIGNIPKPKGVPHMGPQMPGATKYPKSFPMARGVRAQTFAAPTPRLGAGGTARVDNAMSDLRAKSFGNAGSKGRRIG